LWGAVQSPAVASDQAGLVRDIETLRTQ